MAIYSEDENGNPKFFWQYFDELFDFLKEVKLKPIFELSFMPEAISTKPHTLFGGRAMPALRRIMTNGHNLLKQP